MWWRKTKQQTAAGFTIVEVMIVLAVTSLMFISVAVVINGKQQTAQFQTAVNETKVRLGQVANEVASGYFPDQTKNIYCGATYNLVTADTLSGRCMLIGKAVHFYDNTSGGFDVFTIIGADKGTADYTDAQMILAAESNRTGASKRTVPAGPTFDVTETKSLPNGLQAKTLYYYPASGGREAISSFAFVKSLNANNPTAASTGEGASQFMTTLVFPASNGLARSKIQEANAVNDQFDAGNFIVATGTVRVCFASGSTPQHVIMNIGTGSAGSAVSADVRNGNCPA